MAPYFDIA